MGHRYGLWVKEVSTTAGEGDITLDGAVDGFATFVASVPNDTDVLYSIQNGNNREIGVGRIQAGSTLQRLTVRATLAAGVFNDNSPVALTLAGTSEVMITDDRTLMEWAEGLRVNVGSEGHVPVVGQDGILALADEIDGGSF